MKKLISIIFYIFSSSLIHSQPIPDCAKNSAFKIIFIDGNKEIICDLVQGNSIPNEINDCFAIHHYQIKDTLNITYFKFNIYKNINDYSNKKNNMEINIINLSKKKSFDLYLEIVEFKQGIYFIDVSKKRKIKKVNCYMCKDSIEAIDITPKKWYKRRKWKT